MRTGKVNQEDGEYDEEVLVPKKEGTSTPNSTANTKNNDKASAIRSKHSVTEQRGRSKINERFQILRNLIPHSDQRRDTASFLLEVIQYVQHLQEKVKKTEASYQGWSLEPTKLLPWVKDSHWQAPSFVGQPQIVKNGHGPAPSFPGKLEDNTTTITPSVHTSTLNAINPEHCGDNASKPPERQPELANKGIRLMMPQQMNMAGMGRDNNLLDHSLQGPVCDAQSSANELLNQPSSIEGGIISLSSVYSERLLNNLTQALQSTGLDLTQACISVQINFGKRSGKELTSVSSLPKDNENPISDNHSMGHRRDLASGEGSDIAQKLQKPSVCL